MVSAPGRGAADYGSVDPATPAAHALGDPDQQEGHHDGDDRAADVQLAEVAAAQRAGHQTADQRADDAQRQGGHDAEVLLARLDQSRDRAHDQTEHEETDDASDHGPSVPPRSPDQTPITRSGAQPASSASRVASRV